MSLKLNNFVLILIIITVAFYSCRKTQDRTIKSNNQLFGSSFASVTHSNVTQEGNFLHFSDLSAFGTILDGLDSASEVEMNNWEGYFSGYQSMRTYYENMEEAMEVDTFLCPLFDESLATVINSEGIVAVDSVAFLLDFSTNSIYEVYPVNAASIDSLKLKNEINNDSMYLFKYSMDDAIFFPDSFVEQERMIMNDGRSYPVKNSKRAFRWWKKMFFRQNKCTETYADSDKDKDITVYQDPDDECISYRYKVKLKYQKSGLRFLIQAKAKHQKKEGCEAHWRKEDGGACFEGGSHSKVFCGGIQNNMTACNFTPPGHGFSGSNNFSSTTYKQVHYKSWNSLSDYRDSGWFMLWDVARDTAIWTRMFKIERPN